MNRRSFGVAVAAAIVETGCSRLRRHRGAPAVSAIAAQATARKYSEVPIRMHDESAWFSNPAATDALLSPYAHRICESVRIGDFPTTATFLTCMQGTWRIVWRQLGAKPDAPVVEKSAPIELELAILLADVWVRALSASTGEEFATDANYLYLRFEKLKGMALLPSLSEAANDLGALTDQMAAAAALHDFLSLATRAIGTVWRQAEAVRAALPDIERPTIGCR